MALIKKMLTWIGIVSVVILGSIFLWPYLNYGKIEYLHKEGARLKREESYTEALEIYEYLIDADSTDIDAWDSKADVLYLSKYYEKAIESYDQVISLDPQNYNAMLFKAQALGFTGQHEKAINVYNRLLNAGADIAVKLKEDMNPPSTFEILLLEGKAYQLLHLQRYQDALNIYDVALQKSPHDTVLQNNRAQVLMLLNNRGIELGDIN